MNGTVMKHLGLTATTLGLLALAITGCAKNSSLFDGEGDLPVNMRNYPNDTLNNGLPNVFRNEGSSTAPLSDNEKTALQNAANAMDDVNPQESAALSSALMQEAQRLLNEEKQGLDVSAKKLALVGKILGACTESVMELYPRPGQTYVGKWLGNECAVKDRKGKSGPQAPVNFEITGNGLNAPYMVSGAFKGQMGAKPDGTAIVQGTPWSGTLQELPRITGTLNNPKFRKRGNVYDSCAMGVTLRASRNPIPEQYIEMIRRMTECGRKIIPFLTPVMDKLFKNMDPAIAELLLSQMYNVR